MTQPRHVAPGKTYFISRRTTRRHYIFRPDEDGAMQNIFWFCLGVTARELGILVHAATLMSTHVHLVITDTRGVLPDFLREFHRLLANVTKCHRGWPEEVLNADNTSTVELLDANVIIDECGYTIANPVSAGAVRHAHEWPGATVAASEIGTRVVRAQRPSVYFRADNPRWPEHVELPIVMPQQVIDELGSAAAGRDAIASAVRRYEEAAWKAAALEGRVFGTARRAMRTPIAARASSWEGMGARNPTFAARGNRATARLAVRALRGFRAAYRDALDAWKRGVRDVVFPLGTWLMRVLHHADCEPASS